MNATIDDKTAPKAEKIAITDEYPWIINNLQSAVEAYKQTAKYFHEKGDKIMERVYFTASETYQVILKELQKQH